MRIAMVAVPSTLASHTRGATRLARELAAAGHTVQVVGSRAALAEAVRAERVDIVHAHAEPGTSLAIAALSAAQRVGLPGIVTLHGAPAYLAALLAASEAVLGWSRSVVLAGVSNVVATQAARWMPAASVGVLPFGVDLGTWRPLPAPRNAGDVRFASAPTMQRMEEGAALIRAFAAAVRFVAGAPHLRLAIAGDGPQRGALAKLSSELGVADRIEWQGRQDHEALHASYACADVFVAPGARASAATAALEARAAGLPVIARLSSGARDFLTHGTHGFLAGDEEELGRLMARIALEEPLRRFIANRNRREPPAYDWRTVVRLHEGIYEAAAARVEVASPPNQR